MGSNWDWQVYLQDPGGKYPTYWEWMLSAWGWTVSVALLALIVALVLGSLVGIIRTLPDSPWLVRLGNAWVELFRNIPLLVQIFLWYHVIPAVLRYYFKHAELTIEQCIERRVEILEEQRNRLGRANSLLGEDLVLGEHVRDRSGKFRIHIRELDWQRFHEFLPIGFGYQPLCALVRFTLRDPLDYDIRLVLRQEEIRELRIGEQNACRLGWTSWLGREKADGVVTLGSKIH